MIVGFGPIEGDDELIGITDDGVLLWRSGWDLVFDDLDGRSGGALEPNTTLDLRTGGSVEGDGFYRSTGREDVTVVRGPPGVRVLVDGDEPAWTLPSFDPTTGGGRPLRLLEQFVSHDGDRALGVVSSEQNEGPYAAYVIDVAAAGTWTRATGISDGGTFTHMLASAELDRLVALNGSAVPMFDLTAGVTTHLPIVATDLIQLSADGGRLVYVGDGDLWFIDVGAATPLAEQTPNAVTELRAWPGDGEVRLSWQEPDGLVLVDGYTVRITNLITRAEVSMLADDTEVRVGRLDNGAGYRILVAARSSAGDGPVAVATATPNPAPDPPGPVTDVRSIWDASTEAVTVTWEPPTVRPERVSGYTFTTPTNEVTATFDDRRYVISDVSPGSLVNFSIAAYDTGVGPGPTRLGTAYGGGAPEPPTLVEVQGSSSGSVYVSWDAPEHDGGFPVTLYHLWIGDQYVAVDGSGRFFSVEGFEVGETVDVELRAQNAVGLSEPMRTTTTIPAAQAAPGPVTNLAYEYTEDGTIVASWDLPVTGGDVLGYFVGAPSVGGSGAYVDRRIEFELEAGESVEVSIMPIGVDALGERSTLRVFAGAAPTPARSLRLSADGDGSVVVAWAAPLDDGNFDVVYSVEIDGLVQSVAGTSVRADGFAPGATVEVAVQARNVVGGALAVNGSVQIPQPTASPDPEPAPAPTPEPLAEPGYWMVERAGDVYDFGAADPFGAVGAADIVSTATDDDGAGLWILDSAGVVHVRGGADHHGDVDVSALDPGERVATIAVRPLGDGYWVFTDRGRALAFGAAEFHGDMTAFVLNGEIVASTSTADGGGYWMVGSDGGIFSFGNAEFHGSTGSLTLNEPVVGIAPDPDGDGYWLVAADGGIFAFEAEFLGSVPGVLADGASLNAPVIGALAFGDGYLMVASDGGIFNFSEEDFLGSLGGQPLSSPIVGVAAFTS